MFGVIVFCSIAGILFLASIFCFVYSFFKDDDSLIPFAFIIFACSIFTGILGVEIFSKVSKTPETQEKELRQNIIEANNAYQKFLIDHPEFKEVVE